MSIFIQLASYRDPELVKTVEDALNNAKKPEELVFSICWQYHPDDPFTDEQRLLLNSTNQIKVIELDISKETSPGVCWARHQVQQLYDGEDYTLQIDSHMRFAPEWDETLIEMVKNLQDEGYKKPLLTAYAPSFDPENDPDKRVQEAWYMYFDRFIPEGAVFFLPGTIPNWENEVLPVPARFYSAHMAFTIGDFAREVQHDPEFYFHGEEISIAVRAFTHGYDLFHPNKAVIWHEYTRKGRTKQWDDDKKWTEKNSSSHLKNRQLFGMDGEEQKNMGEYGFGSVRTLKDYERYAGIDFKKRAIQQYTKDRKYPPNPPVEDWDASLLRTFKHCIDLNKDTFKDNDYDFWAVIFKDENGEDLHREDADKKEINKLLTEKDPYIKLWREFNTETQPKEWVVWPHSESKGWREMVTGAL